MPEPRLPPELIHCVVDHLFEDIPALASIRFANQTFNLACRRYIFGTVTLTTKSRIEKLDELVASCPSIVPFIKDFAIELPDPDPELNITISRLLRQLTHVTAFEIGSQLLSQWKSWPSTIRSAIKIPLSSPYLDSLSMFHIHGIPTSLLGTCPTLQDLYLVDITFENDCPSVLESRPRLQYLMLGSSDPGPLPSGIPVDLTRLQHLSISYPYPSPGLDGTWIWEEFIEPASKSLKTLDLTQLGMYMVRTSQVQILSHTTCRRARHHKSNRL